MAENFSGKLKHWRLAKGMTQRQLAESMQVTPTYVNLLEKGRTRAPTLERCRQLAEALAVDEREVVRAALQERDPDVYRLLGAAMQHAGLAVPVFPWRVGQPLAMTEAGTPVGEPLRTMVVDGIGDRSTFALELVGDLPTADGALWRQGQVLVFSPRAAVSDGDIALLAVLGDAVVGRVERATGGTLALRPIAATAQAQAYPCEQVAALRRLVLRIEPL